MKRVREKMASETENAGGWATLEQAAQYASVSPDILKEWLADGLEYYEITAEKLIRIKYSDIDNYMGRFRKKKATKQTKQAKQTNISSEVRQKKEKVIETVKNVKRKMALYPQEKKHLEIEDENRGHLSVTNPKTKKRFLIPRSRLAGKENARVKDPETGEVLLFDTKTGDIIMIYGSKKDASEPDENGD